MLRSELFLLHIRKNISLDPRFPWKVLNIYCPNVVKQLYLNCILLGVEGEKDLCID